MYEYKLVERFEPDDFQKELNNLAADGWQLKCFQLTEVDRGNFPREPVRSGLFAAIMERVMIEDEAITP